MLLNKKAIADSQHILIVANNDSFANASAIYSYILTLHKKVSMVKSQDIENNLSFLPWFDKLKSKIPSSADYTLEISSDTKYIFDFLKDSEVKINQKMATALYASLLRKYDFFLSDDCDDTIFILANELIKLKAEHKLCVKHMLREVPLSLFRLKAIMFKSMLLQKNATCANLYISDDELKATGSKIEDAYSIMRELLSLVNVEEVVLFKSDEDNKILKIIKEN